MRLNVLLSLFLASILLGNLHCARTPPATAPTHEASAVEIPLLRNLGNCELRQQWWTEDSLISDFYEWQNPGNPASGGFSSRNSRWLMREARKTSEVTFLQTPESTLHVTSRNGIVWAFVNPQIKWVQKNNSFTLPTGNPTGRIFRCDDFRTWKQIASITIPRGGYIGICEVLDGNKFLMFGRFSAEASTNEYALAEVSDGGTLEIRSILETGSLKNPERNWASFNSVARTKDHILHASQWQGWSLVFDAHTGAFLRLIRCYDYPKVAQSGSRTLNGNLLLSIRPTPEGKFLMASRTREYAMQDRSSEKVSREEFEKEPLKHMQRIGQSEQDRENRLMKATPEIVWRNLDAESSEMVVIPTPEGGIGRLDVAYEDLFYTICFGPDGTLRSTIKAAARN